MIVRLWGTRGSLASSGPETAGYGGNTAAVEIVNADGSILALDAGTGIRRLGAVMDPSIERLDVLLTHLHMDHIQGLGFFAPFFRPSGEIHIWGPASATMELRARLTRYLSPPLFPVRIRDLDARVLLHDAPEEPVSIGGFDVLAQPVIIPGPTVGYRISADGASVRTRAPALRLRQDAVTCMAPAPNGTSAAPLTRPSASAASNAETVSRSWSTTSSTLISDTWGGSGSRDPPDATRGQVSVPSRTRAVASRTPSACP